MSKRALIVAFFILLFILHQDFWWKNDATLVLGVLPISLAYHVGWTLLVAFGWFLVAKYCWPKGLDEVATATKAKANSPQAPGRSA